MSQIRVDIEWLLLYSCIALGGDGRLLTALYLHLPPSAHMHQFIDCFRRRVLPYYMTDHDNRNASHSTIFSIVKLEGVKRVTRSFVFSINRYAVGEGRFAVRLCGNDTVHQFNSVRECWTFLITAMPHGTFK